MKKLVIFYSFEGNTKFVAETIAKAVDADILELKPEKEMKTHSFFKYMIGGAQVVFKIKPKLKPFSINPQDYDLIFIGTPAWALDYTPTMRSFLSSAKINDKQIALFSSRMTNGGKTLKTMKKKLVGNEFIGELDLSQPLLKEKEKNLIKIQKWSKEMIRISK